MKELGLNPSDAELQDLVNEADTNKDGVICFDGLCPLPENERLLSRAEFLHLMSQSVREQDTEQELINAFKVFDKDNSGTISTEELRNVLRSLGENLTDAELDEMVNMADVNGDGQIDCRRPFPR